MFFVSEDLVRMLYGFTEMIEKRDREVRYELAVGAPSIHVFLKHLTQGQV